MASRLDLVMMVALIAGVLLLIEHRHRLDVEIPVAGSPPGLDGAVCPDHENVPYGTDCIAFMQGGRTTDVRWRMNGTKSKPAAASETSGAPCLPNNENAPYSARCISFMEGSGYFWSAGTARADTPQGSPATAVRTSR